MFGHLFFENFLQDGLHTLPDPGFHIPFHGVLEFLLRGSRACVRNTDDGSVAMIGPGIVVVSDRMSRRRTALDQRYF